MSLPIDSVIPEIISSLYVSNRLVLQAPPGAGKTTVVPLKLLSEDWLAGGKIILLEPRRLAAISSARRMAELLGESVGQRVGYRVRLESKVSDGTIIEVVTEGIFTRMIQDDPELSGVGAVIFDEFHERSIQADLSLAVTLDCQEGLREDLRIILMSATLDGDRLGELLNAPVVISEGRTFPVDISWNPPRDSEYPVEHAIRIVKQAVHKDSGSILLFLPGVGEIRRVEEGLRESSLPSNIMISPLYGTLSRKEQDRAILPAAEGMRKIVLATNIAETSLTIEGITVVVDSGLCREPHYDPGSGMTRLRTGAVSKASSVQRAGRAGRTAPGKCYRLWSEQQQSGRIDFHRPEILSAELSPLLLELSLWGVSDPTELFWIDEPPAPALNEAKELLMLLGAIDSVGRITSLGSGMAVLGVHPRLARMILAGRESGSLKKATVLAALLSERDILRPRDRFEQADISLRMDTVERFHRKENINLSGFYVDRGAVKRVCELADSWKNRVGRERGKKGISTGILLATAFPDRVALRRKEQSERYLLVNGGGVHLNEGDPLNKSELIVVASCMAREKDAKIFLAGEISRDDVEELFADQLTPQSELFWNSQEKRVVAREVVRLGAILFSEQKSQSKDPEKMSLALIEGIREMGLRSLPWSDAVKTLLNRLRFLHTHFPEVWPDMSDKKLLDDLELWLKPFLTGITGENSFSRIDLLSALKAELTWEQLTELDRLAPERIKVPEGSRMKIDYSEEPPVLAVKLQMMFGATETPAVADGKVPLLIHLLSPAGRPIQITQDLVGFWDGSYNEVKKDMKGRYPRHPWPDNPRDFKATAKTNRAIQREKKS